MKTSGRQDGSPRDEERGVAPARDRDLPRRSVDVLRDLGLSKEKIVAYHRRFPVPTPTRRGACADRPGVDDAAMIQERAYRPPPSVEVGGEGGQKPFWREKSEGSDERAGREFSPGTAGEQLAGLDLMGRGGGLPSFAEKNPAGDRSRLCFS